MSTPKKPLVKTQALSPSEKRRIANASANAAARAALVQSRPSTDHVGDLVWWDIVLDWKGDVARVANAAAAAGLDPITVLPESPDWPLAFGRAVQSLRTTIGADDFTLWDAEKGPNGERRVAIMRISREAKVSSEDLGTIVCPKDGSKPYVERDDPHGIGQRILAAAAEYYGVFIADDLRAAVTTILLRWGAMPCRRATPHIVYWLPSAGASTLRQVADAFESVGWGRVEFFAGYASDERSQRAAVNAVNTGLEARLTEFAEEVNAYTARATDKQRATTIANRIEDAKRLREQAALYRTILGEAVASIDDRVAKVEDVLKRALGVIEASESAA